ncbi:MAG: tyrosine-type recombinase/integrase [Chloroflexi bacterium]|nr:tyrosine-type recombinase/integrase [Chloroflexota bacterium]
MARLQQTGSSKKSRYGGGSITKLPSGSWIVKWYGPADQDGNRKRLAHTVKSSKGAANKKLRELQSAVDDGTHVDKSKVTVKEFAATWMETYVATNCTLRTAKGYQGNIDRYIIPYIGKVAVQNLATTQIQGIYAVLLERGLSHTTVLHTHRVLKQILGYAVKSNPPVIAKNPADAATPPKREKKQMAMWDVPTIHRFLDESKGTRYGHIFDFAINTGMRRSEICGLRWYAVDLVAGRLEVVATLQQIRGHGLVTGAPKTKKSRRNLTLSSDTVALLQAVQGAQILAKDDAGPLWQNTGYVFAQANGSPVLPDSLTAGFAALVKELELPHLSFHGLRHGNATLALLAGINPKIVSEALGHSSVTITLDTYSHVLPNMQDGMANAVATLLKRSTNID